MLQRVLRSRIVFTPRANPLGIETDGYDFEAPTRFDKLFAGIAAKRPAALVPGDISGCENIGPEDTCDCDYGALLERAYGKGVTSPTGNPSLCSPLDVWFPRSA